MSLEVFGQAVKSLRQEQLNLSTGRPWSQSDLAAATNLSRAIIGNIERGERAGIDVCEVQKLTRALRLSSLEEQEFIRLASGFAPSYMALNPSNDNQSTKANADSDPAFDYIWSILAETPLPAYLSNSLGNIVGINHNMMRFHSMTDQMLDVVAQSRLGANVLALLFRPGAVLRKAMAERWETIARANIHIFRVTVLTYRHLERFEIMLDELFQLPDFRHLWFETRLNPANDFFSQVRQYQYIHKEFGAVTYLAKMATTLTCSGNLYLTTLVPMDVETTRIFAQLNEQASGVRTVMPWPDLLRS